MTAVNQDFTIYSGSDDLPRFTVYSDTANTTALNISAVTQITFTVQRDLSTAVALTKTKTGGSITFVTDGNDGAFQVAISKTDTAALTGYYIYQATITDTGANISVVATGRLNVARAPAWTYSGDPTTSNKDAIRFLIGDTLPNDPQVYDGEISYAYTTRGTVYGAAAMCCRAMATQYSRRVDSVQSDLRTVYSSMAKAYAMRAIEYDARAAIDGAGSAGLLYAGGISLVDKQTREDDTDRVKPQFNLGMTDNSIPVGPAGNELPSSNDDSD